MIKIALIMCFSSAVQRIAAQDFSYKSGQNGPSQWGEEFNTCKGKHQSPIDIDILHVKKVKLPLLRFHNFDKTPSATTIMNNGHTVQLTIDSDEMPTVSGGPFTGPYEFSQLHFHWGDNNTYGSEDSFNGLHFPMELHVVMFKKEYGNSTNAMTKSDGLAVLAFFFNIVPVNNLAYEEMSELLETIKTPPAYANVTTPPSLMHLLTVNLHEYYVYNGSLSTPPCLEIVTWLDFYDPIEISPQQIKRFRDLKDNEGDPLNHNFRPVQPIGDRIVWFTSDNLLEDDNDVHDYINRNMKKQKNNGNCVTSSLMLFSMIVFIVALHKIFIQ